MNITAAFIGGGNMGGALIRGLIARGLPAAEHQRGRSDPAAPAGARGRTRCPRDRRQSRSGDGSGRGRARREAAGHGRNGATTRRRISATTAARPIHRSGNSQCGPPALVRSRCRGGACDAKPARPQRRGRDGDCSRRRSPMRTASLRSRSWARSARTCGCLMRTHSMSSRRSPEAVLRISSCWRS